LSVSHPLSHDGLAWVGRIASPSYMVVNGIITTGPTLYSSAQLQQVLGVLTIHTDQHIFRQPDAVQSRRGCPTCVRCVIGVRDRTPPNPPAFPKRTLTPVSANVVLAR